MSTASQEKENTFGSDAGLLHQIALSLRAVCKDEGEARTVASKLAHDRPFLTNVVTLAVGKPKKRSVKGLVNSTLLEPVSSISVEGVEGFSARQMMSKGANEGATIYWVGDNFKKHFLNSNGKGKIELDVPAKKLRVHRLLQNSKDPAIIAELGGEPVVETNLATMFELMKKQGQGQSDGILLVDGKANIFYIRDDAGTLWAVSCYWYAGDGWYVEASPLSYPLAWHAGGLVFSR